MLPGINWKREYASFDKICWKDLPRMVLILVCV